MNLKALKVLEYSKIKAIWSEEAVSSMVKEKAAANLTTGRLASIKMTMKR